MNTQFIASTIIASRKKLGLTQIDLAKLAGISRRTLILIESGEQDISFRKLERILNALGMTLTISQENKRPTESQLAEIFKDDD